MNAGSFRFFNILASSALLFSSISANAYSFRIPIEISSTSKLPYTEVELEGEKYLLAIDLGSKFPLSLPKNILEKLDTTLYGSAKWKDLLGNDYESAAYIIPEITIGDLIFSNIIANEEKHRHLYSPRDGVINVDRTDGIIGRALLSKFNLLLDFSNAVIHATDDIDYLNSQGYRLKKFQKLSFERPSGEIVFQIETDIGRKRFILDTGCTASVLNSHLLPNHECKTSHYGIPVFRTSKFSIGNHDFGAMDLYLFNIPSQFGLDGCLGMDFLQRHIVYIDFDEKLLYIAETEPSNK